LVEIVIDPVNRLEGHMGVTVNIEDGVVTDAKTHGNMFRGFELVVGGRDPRDAPILLQRICGVCHTEHRLCSLRAIEDAAGVTVPDGARKIRNLIEVVTTLYSHAIWFYALAGPDYSRAFAGTDLERINYLTGAGYKEAVRMQRTLHEVLAIFGAKAPHHMTTAPGGVTLQPTVDHIARALTRLVEVSNWIGATENVPAVIDNVAQGKFDPSLGSALHDIVGMIMAAKEMGADGWGEGPNRFLSFGVYDLADGSSFEPAGFFDGSRVRPLDERKITEDVKHSWYTDDSGGMYVGDEPPLKPAYGKGGAYSWAKSPRYGRLAAEAGPLARMVVLTELKGSVLGDPFDLRKKLAGGATAANVLSRIIARAQEILLLRDALVRWMGELAPGEKVSVPYEVPQDAFGMGLWEAPRGALGHWVHIQEGKVERYQVITPTAWNVGPRDNNGQRGPIEQALVGVPETDLKKPMNVVRTVRSFDPCLACTVHVMTPGGKKYHIEMGHLH
jgi:hydrogenase large subunit